MLSFFRYFVLHRTAANLLLAAMLVVGVYGASQIRAQFFPDVVSETVTVRVAWSGAGPTDVDAAVVDVLEPELRAVDGVTETRTLAREGSASIVLEFEPNHDMSQALTDVDAALDAAGALPEDAEDPTVSLGRFRDRVTDVVIAGPVGLERLGVYAEELRGALFRAGVTRVEIAGRPSPRLMIEVDDAALERHGLTLQEIADAVGAEIEARPAGALDSAGARLRAGAERRDVDALREIVVAAGTDGGRLTVGDVATIRDARFAPLGLGDDQRFFVRGGPAVELRVERPADGDAIEIQRIVERVAAEYEATAPDGVTVELTRTRAQAIIDRLDILIDNALAGLLIVLALLFLFLSARTAFWVAAGVPAALAATIGLMWAFGLSLNMLSLFALIITLGIIVDDAIVVGEHADRLRRDGRGPADAASEAARRMWGPVFSASITTLIAFASLVAISGRFGDLVKDIPFTVSVVLLASLVECFLVLPNHMKHALEAGDRRAWYDAPSRVVNRGFDWVRERLFRPLMRWALLFRYPLLGGAVGLLAFSASMLVDRTVQWRFINFPERGTVAANIVMLPGATREDTFAQLEEMRRAMDVVSARLAEEHGADPIVSHVATVGGTLGRGLSAAETAEADRQGGFQLELIDADLRPYSAFDFIREWRAEIDRGPLLQELALRGDRSGPGGDAIDVSLSGDASAATLKAAATDLIAALSALPGVSALEDSLNFDKPEIVLELTPLGRALGFDANRLAADLRGRIDGVEAARFADGDAEGVIEVLLADDALQADFLSRARLPIPGGTGATIALSEIAEARVEQGFASVRRLDGLIVAAVTGEIAEDPATRAAVRAALEDEILPDLRARYGLTATQGGEREQERQFLGDALIGFAICLVGIYLTLSWIFASWTRPMVVMLVIPFGFIGALWGHWVHDVPFSMFSVVGLIGMAGIIINDSIVLVTTIDEKARTRPMSAAIVDGAADRLRAVLLTTLTTVGGLAPLLFETSRAAQFLLPTVITLAYGLGFGMLLVLLLTPAIVLMQKDVGLALGSARRATRLLARRALGRRTASG